MKFKKIIPLLLSICMVGSVFAGCSDTDTSEDGGDTNNTDTSDASGDSGADTGSGDTSDTDTDTGSGDTSGDSTTGGGSDSGKTDTEDDGEGNQNQGDDTASGDTGDTGSGDTGDTGDTGSGDTGDTGDTGSGDTGSDDTGDTGDTGSGDTGSGDTGSGDTGDTGSGDTGSGDTGSGDTGDTGSGDTGGSDTGNTGVVETENLIASVSSVSSTLVTLEVSSANIDLSSAEYTVSYYYDGGTEAFSITSISYSGSVYLVSIQLSAAVSSESEVCKVAIEWKDSDGNVVALAIYTPAETDVEEDTTNGGTVTTTVYMVGDSTMCSFSDNYYIPRYGYGTQLSEYLNENVTVVNLAMSGRSSLSFLSESNYSTLKSSIGEGDYLIIGFGHNDEKSDDADRFTDPNPDYQTQYSSSGSLSFQYNLYENYIKLAEEAGATAILCTPIVRYNSSANYTGSSAHITSDGDYAQAIRDLGEDTNTTVIDLTALTKADYLTKLTDAQYYHAYTTYTEDDAGNKTPSGIDTTHINMYGAKMVCYELVTALQSTSNQLKHYVKSDITEPTYDTDFAAAINTSYEKPDYSGFDTTSTTATSHNVTSDWYHTAFGTLGGSSKVSNYTFTYASDVYTITAGNGSKIGETNDGFGAIFMQIDKTVNFTLTATATLTNLGSSSGGQSAFGLMLRDDIYIDTSETTILSNYVSAGILGTGSGKAIFSRENSTLTTESNSVTASADSSFELSITRVGQSVTVTVGSYTKTYTDFDFFSVDNDYMYLCMFATRDITVEFSNVTYTYTGVAQDA